MKHWITRVLMIGVSLGVAGCAGGAAEPESPIGVEVHRDATVMRGDFSTTRIAVTAPPGRRIVVRSDGDRTEEIALSDTGAQGGRGAAEIFVVAALTPLPDEEEALLHWTAHLRSGGSELGGPTEPPRRVSADDLAEVFAVAVREGEHDLTDSIVSITVGEDQYDFAVE